MLLRSLNKPSRLHSDRSLPLSARRGSRERHSCENFEELLRNLYETVEGCLSVYVSPEHG